MSNLQEFYEARNTIQEIIRADLLGPMTGEPEEIINVKYPTSYYIVGKLYPVSMNTQMILLHDDAEELTEVKKTDDVLLENKYGKRKNDEDSEEDDEVSGCNILNPSAMGITFAVKKDTKKIKVILNYALYKPITADEAKIQKPDIEYSSSDSLWKRYPAEKTFEFDLTIGKKKSSQIVSDGKTLIGELVLIQHKSAKNEKDVTRYTLSLKNIQEKQEQKPIDEAQKTIFQPQIKIFIPDGHFIEVKRHLKLNNIKKEDERNREFDDGLVMDLLYSKVKSYAQGHGCAVSWNKDEQTGDIISIQTEFLPEEQILQMRPVNLKDLQEYCKDITFNNKLFSTAYLKNASKEDITSGINQLCNVYQIWIDKQREQISNLEDRERFEDVATNNLDLCEKSLERIRNSAKIIANDDDIYKAFRYANEAIYEQNRHKEWITAKESNPELKINEVDNDFEWRPFQLAFILQELESIANPKSKDRNLTDLLWFPTGGGKTEAYLGLAAFTIFLRRLKHPKDNKGVTVLTRYTYRLLTFQQFERTLRLICACEQIRKNKNIPGERISIGLWIGKDYTPNNICGADGAYSFIKKKQNENNSTIKTGSNSHVDTSDKKESNPIQVTRCPWCGKNLTAQNYSFDSDKSGGLKSKDPERMFIHCSNPECEYSKNKNEEGIPAIVIDEQIYSETPTFVVATVDKFAQIPLKAKAGAMFGYLENEKRLLPPELIIQDELHLLTGPLGTITGIYEAGFKKLCELNGHYPKVISSTATVKNAKSQIKSLYGDEYSQFPAQGLDITDSFFAKQSKENERPGRMYMGCMAVGTTPITMMVRVMAILYFATRYISTCKKYSSEVIDSFYTMTGYFNTLRELGGAIIRATDDVDARVKILCKKYEKKYPWIKDDSVKSPKELTSRVPSSDIGKILRTIEEGKYEDELKNFAEDYLFATNMISVGVDIDRLGTMIVVGQPKMTAEYIQSTSRVGRKYPGLVITTYNQKKSRDRSHFEQFKQYHQSFYKFVEATSITPFSDRARNRVLHTIYVMLCRYLIPELRNNAAFRYIDHNKDINKESFNKTINDIKLYLLEAVNKIDSDEKNNVEKELEIIDNEWFNIAKDDKKLTYTGNNGLFDPDTNEESRFRVMNNMRSVEKTAKAKLHT